MCVTSSAFIVAALVWLSSCLCRSCRLKRQRLEVSLLISFPILSLLLQDICEDISDHVEQIHALLETEFSLKLLSYSVNIIVDIRLVPFQYCRV